MRDRKIAIPVFILAFCLIGAVFPQGAKDRVAPENANEARLNSLQPPDKVMDIIGAAPGMTIVEIGAGRGRYIVHLANRVGPRGKIYAEDIDEAALRHCAERCRRNGFDNVETILGGFTDPKLPKNSLDLIFVISSYHHFDDPVTLMKNALPALKPTGRLAIAEWVRLPGQRGEGTAPETMKTQMEEAGYVLESIDKTFEKNRMYIYLFRLRPVEGLPILKGPYLGQKPPGLQPEVFAPGHGAAQIDIYYSEWKNGAYAEPVRMGPEINSEYPEIDPMIAPDKSCLLFTSPRPDGYSRRMNLYVSFRAADGGWTPAQCLSHTLKIDNIWFPSLSADGAYLFFCGGYPTDKGYTDSQYYWVSTKIMEELRPKENR